MPHLNNQIWIRTGFVSDNTNRVNCVALFICTYTKYTQAHSEKTTSKAQHTSILITGRCFIFTFQKPKCDYVREAACCCCVFLLGEEKQQLCFTGNSVWLSLFHVEAIRSIMKSLDQSFGQDEACRPVEGGGWALVNTSTSIPTVKCSFVSFTEVAALDL